MVLRGFGQVGQGIVYVACRVAQLPGIVVLCGDRWAEMTAIVYFCA